MTEQVLPGAHPETAARIRRREADWRTGHLLYQVIVDRFAPSKRLDAKREHYAFPRVLKPWTETPAPGKYLYDHQVSEQEAAFWGGDLESLRSHLDYIQQLGIDVLYLNPIFRAFSNHKYDGSTYEDVDPHYGTTEDVRVLADELHRRGMRLMLDGVFNHLGRRSDWFQAAKSGGPEAEWFYFGEQYKNGYRGWRNVANLPEINLENQTVLDRVYRKPDSAVQHWLRDIGIDGWRLDVAPDIGFEHLKGITDAAHLARPDSVVIGECWNYPEDWLHVLDGIMNMHARLLVLNLVEGKMSPRAVGRSLERMVDDCGIEGLLRSHLILDNHDLPRIATTVPDRDRRRIAWALTMALPGCPVIYYGSENGMEGGADPTNRAPMRWDMTGVDNPDREFTLKLIDIRKRSRALRIGDFRILDTEHTLGFLRTTDRWRDTRLVLVNPTTEPVHEVVSTRFSRLMDVAPMECLLTGDHLNLHCGMIEATIPPLGVRIYEPRDYAGQGGYSMYKRVP